ncbi:hypothetical protein AVEN_105782-1 [Araneus ventricosus]|uniref:Peptidase aspartic putative domain-containing protein n=1 Tax=Araneus ventricosus TaxID=182803 RepID=A0A4Y2FZZ6_ARAVE|nr:hypothetical protein AVEN_105782-1 [Araneus ventricosus]
MLHKHGDFTFPRRIPAFKEDGKCDAGHNDILIYSISSLFIERRSSFPRLPVHYPHVHAQLQTHQVCEAVESRKHESKKTEEKEAANDVNMSNISLGPKVLLQTLKVKMISDNKEVSVRIILDSGSQRSYILRSLAAEMGT